ncbi:MAG: glycosyltransferase family 4 protein [Thiotrichales bacterium]
MIKEKKVLIFWEGFPVCGLLLTRVVREYNENVVIVATKPAVPFNNMEKELGREIVWLSSPNDIWERREEFKEINFVIHTGWNHRGWIRFDKYLKKRNNAKIIFVVDNNVKNNLRQLLGAIYFRVVMKRIIDGVFVPGRQGQKLMRSFGVRENRIYLGNYGAYEKIYNVKVRFDQRRNEFLYVGQLNKRKSVDIILEAFQEYRGGGGNWGLRILGDGELRNLCVGDGVTFEGFAQPHVVADKMNQSKVFILISREDHWGTVVCEAAACGMNIITANTVGAADDIVRKNINGTVIDKICVKELVKQFNYYEQLAGELLAYGSEVSKSIAQGYNSTAYFAAFQRMMFDLN